MLLWWAWVATDDDNFCINKTKMNGKSSASLILENNLL